MTNGLDNAQQRRLACACCGTEFACEPAGACWCMEEAVRLPLPIAPDSKYQDCLCRDCLLGMAAKQTEPAH